ncbi:MAG: RluA family pseudouridine synthase [Desulfamplus sp.]|nr:RluA family pseudouridine synthase [Desulfamplus sp.]
MEIKFVVDIESDGNRLDYVVAAKLAEYSRSLVAQLIKNGEILVSGKTKKPSSKVYTGDIISGFLNDCQNKELIATGRKFLVDSENKIIQNNNTDKIPFNIIHDDSHILVINKDYGVVVHPGAGNNSGTLVDSLISYCPQIQSVGEDSLRPGIVHRLDKDTSGVMVVAKTNQAFLFLKKEFMQRRVEKRYLALVSGNIKENLGKVILPIGRHPVKRKMMSTLPENGRYAETIWIVKQRYGNATLVEAELKTGRTHQVRVHFKAIGHPLVGDPVYGFKKGKVRLQGIKKEDGEFPKIQNTISRQMLHAWKLSFRHPWSGKKVEFIASLPDDMARFIDCV